MASEHERSIKRAIEAAKLSQPVTRADVLPLVSAIHVMAEIMKVDVKLGQPADQFKLHVIIIDMIHTIEGWQLDNG